MHGSNFPWQRFRRMMRWMVLLTVVTVVAALGLFYAEFGLVSIHFYIATALGMSAAVMLMGVLMALAYVSNSSGHDAAANDVASDQTAGDDSR